MYTEEIKTAGKGLQPVYSSSEKAKKKSLDSRGIARLMRTFIEQVKDKDVPEFLPVEILERYRLISRYQAMLNIHFPKSEYLLNEAQRRLKFEELFIVQLQLMKIKSNRNEVSKGFFLRKLIISSTSFTERI